MPVVINKHYGKLNDTEIQSVLLTNNNGMKAELITYGATLTHLNIPLSDKKTVDVVLGFSNVEDYVKSYDLPSPPYIGATIGRYAGRINDSKFQLNDTTIQLNPNHGKHILHGGTNGFHKKNWTIESMSNFDNAEVTFSLISEDGDENFPGELTVFVTYCLTNDNQLVIEYTAKSSEDTVVNLTHHSYFNLDGHKESIENQKLFVNANSVLEKNEEQIPTGVFLDVKTTSFAFLEPKNCPTNIDDSFVINDNQQIAASLYSENNKLKMSVFTNQPAVHIYVGGNCFDAISGKENVNYHKTSGICFETQNFPDAPNHANFPSSILKKGATYYQKTAYKFETI